MLRRIRPPEQWIGETTRRYIDGQPRQRHLMPPLLRKREAPADADDDDNDDDRRPRTAPGAPRKKIGKRYQFAQYRSRSRSPRSTPLPPSPPRHQRGMPNLDTVRRRLDNFEGVPGSSGLQQQQPQLRNRPDNLRPSEQLARPSRYGHGGKGRYVKGIINWERY